MEPEPMEASAAPESEPVPVPEAEPVVNETPDPVDTAPATEFAPCEEAEPAVSAEEPAEDTACPVREEPALEETEPVSEPMFTAPADVPAAPEKPAHKGLHFTATVSIILTALTFLFGTIALLGLLVSMHPGVIIFMAILTILLTPLCFGFGVASFIIGLKNKRPVCWIIGLIAAIFALISFCFGIIYLIAGVFVAAA